MAAKKKKAAKRAARKPAKKTAKKTARRTPRHKPESLRLRECMVGFTVNDIEKSRAFYRDVLGFTESDSWLVGGKLMGLEMKAGTISVWIGQDDWAKGRDRKKGEGVRLHLATAQNVDQIAANIEKQGGKLDAPPATMPWGARQFSITDPDGFKISISSEG